MAVLKIKHYTAKHFMSVCSAVLMVVISSVIFIFQ